MYYVQDERTSPIAMTRHMQCILLCTVHTILTWRTSFARLRSPMNFSEQTKAIHYYHVYVSSVFHSTIWISIIMCADATGDWRAEHRTYLTIKKYQMKFFSVLLSFTYGDGTSPILCIHYIELIFHQTNTNHFKGFVLWSRLHTDAKTSNRLIRMNSSISSSISELQERIRIWKLFPFWVPNNFIGERKKEGGSSSFDLWRSLLKILKYIRPVSTHYWIFS